MFGKSAKRSSAGGQKDVNGSYQAGGAGAKLGGLSPPAPILIHFDIYKTVLQSQDTVQMKTTEDCIREGIAELFWGSIRKDSSGSNIWVWDKSKGPSFNVAVENKDVCSYMEFCKSTIKDKNERRALVKNFHLANDSECKEEMNKVLHVCLKKTELPADIRHTKEAEDVGLITSAIGMLPAIFQFAAVMQRSKRHFAILFRSFGVEHERIKMEWNAFCEMKHPLYSHLLEGIGPMDGSVQGVPDRRIHNMHTLYRDAAGPMLIVNHLTNGPEGKAWDQWAKQKPKAKTDSRGGRDYVSKQLKAQKIDGFENLKRWMRDHLSSSATSAIKDDWAWWSWNDESHMCGKPLASFTGGDDARQLFFDDNIEFDNTRVVDCRDQKGEPMPAFYALNQLVCKVNTVEVLLDQDYFLKKLQVCHNEQFDMVASVFDIQKHLVDVEDHRASLLKQVKTMQQQLKTLTDENIRMKMLKKIDVQNEEELAGLLESKEYDINFGEGSFRSISELYFEIENGHCWLEESAEHGLQRTYEQLFVKIQYKDQVLIESHEQGGSQNQVQTRNYLPGIRKSLKDSSFNEPLNKWLEKALGMNLRPVVVLEQTPTFTPDAMQQQTQASNAYPIPTRLQMSQATFVISEKSVQMHPEDFTAIGLPDCKHFTSVEHEIHGGTMTRFFRWDRLAAWEATNAQAKRGGGTEQIDVAQVCAKIFGGHPRREVYENLLLQMFETFTAKKLCGGFSGSIVIRCQPFNAEGRPIDPCIVKLDAGEAIRDEYVNSVAVFEALPDRAAKILGDAVYARNKENEEFGAMRLELAGACWSIPELAMNAGTTLFTFKDLLLYESEQMLLGSHLGQQLTGERPFGQVYGILAETFGGGGVVEALRNGGNGVRRHPNINLLWGNSNDPPWYTLKGKEGKFNPYTAKKGEYPPEAAMRNIYRNYFGSEMPDLKKLVVDTIKPKLIQLAGQLTSANSFMPLVGLAHGDLNAANIMIDALDAVWLIDFATSIELPLFMDMCKFEMACLFEYATIPITPQTFIEFAGEKEEMWAKLSVGDWLRVDQEPAAILLRELFKLPPVSVRTMTAAQLDELIHIVAKRGDPRPHKQKGIIRALKARLTANEFEMQCGFQYAAKISQTLIQGDYLLDSLNIKGIPEPEPVPGKGGVAGANSLRFFLDVSQAVRKFMHADYLNTLKNETKGNVEAADPADCTSLNMWLPFLRESYRIIGYKDISPQQKCWSIYHCQVVANKVLEILGRLESAAHRPRSLAIMDSLNKDMNNAGGPAKVEQVQLWEQPALFSEIDAYWITNHKDLFTAPKGHDALIRKVHSSNQMYKGKSGLFAPVYEVLNNGGNAVQVVFDGKLPPDRNVMKLELKDEASVDPDLKGVIGWVTTGTNGKEVVTLKSRLFYATTGMLDRQLDPEPKTDLPLSNNFALGEWCPKDVMDLITRLPPRSISDDKEPKKLGKSPETPQSLVLPDEALCYLKLNLVVKDYSDQIQGQMRLVLGCPVLCYSPGTNIIVDREVVPPARSGSPEMIIFGISDNGMYRMRDADDPKSETERDFDATVANHVWMRSTKYQVGQKLLVSREKETGHWLDGVVVATNGENDGYRATVKVTIRPTDEGLPSSEKTVLRHVNSLNSGSAWLEAAEYEEEVGKMKGYYQARHSFIIDALSGMKLDVKSCAAPTLSITMTQSPQPGKEPVGQNSMSLSDNTRSKLGIDSMPSRRRTMSRHLSLTNTEAVQDSSHGWKMVLAAVERYEQKCPSLSHNAFMITGSPGSGKTCLTCRLIMEVLDRHEDIVPMLLPVVDLVKRTDDGSTSPNPDQVHVWFDKFLRLTFGEGSPRYKMVRQAMSMHRIMFLFEGLEDGAKMTPLVERLIKELSLERHLVFVTSRPLVGTCSLVHYPEYIQPMEVQALLNEQKKSVAAARLGLEGIGDYDLFMKKVRQASGKMDDEGDAGEGQEDVFGNPMMLSMLLNYLLMRINNAKLKASEEGSAQDDSEDQGITITGVYRLALEVMLARVQSKSQADRHNKEAKVDLCKRICGKMAMMMNLKQKCELGEDVIEQYIFGGGMRDLIPVWENLKEAVYAGQALFLRLSYENGKPEYRFLVKGFQDYFAASYIHSQGGSELPPLVPLVTNPWWSQMLDMLAEAWAVDYKGLVETLHEKFEVVQGESFLHLCSKCGHKPVFKLLKLFSERIQNQLTLRNLERATPLHIAAERGNTLIVSHMLEHNAEVDVSDHKDYLPLHRALMHGHFSTAKFLLERYMEVTKDSGKDGKKKKIAPKSSKLDKLVHGVLATNGQTNISEEEFLNALTELFPELSFFTKAEAVEKKKAICSLLTVYWIAANQYEQFVRGQGVETRLTKSSWDKLQDWTKRTVGLTDSTETVSSMLVLVCVQRLGFIKDFRTTFAPDLEDPTAATAHIMQRFPILSPTFSKMDESQQALCISALKADFNFGQFLQGENLPASLFVVKEVLNASQGESDGGKSKNSGNVLGFLLFRIFAGMCSVLAAKSLEGSLFMSDKMYTNFKVGLDVLQHLGTMSAQEVYNHFLEKRAEDQGLNFFADDPESRACVRLACVSRTFMPQEAKKVEDAFFSLTAEERWALADFLNADGITSKGFLIYRLPEMMEAAKNSQKISLVDAMRLLLKVYMQTSELYKNGDSKVIDLRIEDLVNHSKSCQDQNVYQFTKFSVSKVAGRKAEVQGQVHMSPWQLTNDQAQQEALTEEADAFVTDIQAKLMREQGFTKRITSTFPELKFFAGDEEVTTNVMKQTICAMLCVFWVATDQMEAFARGHPQGQKISEKSWEQMKGWKDVVMTDPRMLHALLVASCIHGIGKIPKLKEQLAPEAKNHKQVLGEVMANCPMVLPSWSRLPAQHRNLIKKCLTLDFSFESLLQTECLPANLNVIKELLSVATGQDSSEAGDEVAPSSILDFYLFVTFAELAGSMGAESMEGAVYMNETNFRKFYITQEALRMLEKGQPENYIYDKILEGSADVLGLQWDSYLATRALVRLCCLSKVYSKDVKEVNDCFNAMEERDQYELTRCMCVDGVNEKPAFQLKESPNFLEVARNNKAVGLGPAMKIMLKVYQAAAKQFYGTQAPILTIELQQLLDFTRDFFGSVMYEDLPFELKKLSDERAVVIPKLWIPCTDNKLLDAMRTSGLELATQVFKRKLTEDAFKTRIGRIFPELTYFPASLAELRNQTYGAMLSVFWLTSNNFDGFTKSQNEDEMLQRHSWQWLQDWLKTYVRVSNEKVVDAVLCFMAIHKLVGIPEFREELAPGSEPNRADPALARVLEAKPEVVPSFMRLSEKYQQLIIGCLRCDFQLQHFLQAETTPATLSEIKDMLQPHAEEGYQFFCFAVFCKMCGRLGHKGLNGSLVMTETEFHRARPGLESLRSLMITDANTVFNSFMLLRGNQAMSRFASNEHQALARLLCMSSAFSSQDGNAICDAFSELALEERKVLTKWLVMDGYILNDASTLFQAAQANPAVGVKNALRALLYVQEKCKEAGWNSGTAKVIINLGDLSSWAEDAGPDPSTFLQAVVSVRSVVMDDIRVVTVDVLKPATISKNPSIQIARHASPTSSTCELIFTSFAMLVLSLSFFGLALCFFFEPKLVRRALPADRRIQSHVMPRRFAALSVAFAVFFFIICCVRCHRRLNGRCSGGLETILDGGYSRLRQEDDVLV